MSYYFLRPRLKTVKEKSQSGNDWIEGWEFIPITLLKSILTLRFITKFLEFLVPCTDLIPRFSSLPRDFYLCTFSSKGVNLQNGYTQFGFLVADSTKTKSWKNIYVWGMGGLY